ncbi:MAG: UDP-N-acetylmuramate dehydrogenase [Clostridia bacterium]|nr:UDP-N-acetylmuramate dehydrogenase [Clostridia bacterium]
MDIAAFCEKNGIECFEREPLCAHTSFKVGGEADFFLKTPSRAAPRLIRFLNEEKIPFFLLGKGTNTVARDEGFRGAVVNIIPEEPRLCGDGVGIECPAGASLRALALFAFDNSLTGLEFAHGIPGSVGGAVYMNAGAYGGSISDVLFSSVFCDGEGNIKEIAADAHDFGYRKSFFSENPGLTVLSSVFKLQKGDRAEIEKKMSELSEKRRATQPLSYPSAGSVFKRPEGHFAGKLIEDCGLKGFTRGGAQVSEKHAGFIVNAGGATFADIAAVIKHVQKTVYDRFGVTLEPEIKILGGGNF